MKSCKIHPENPAISFCVKCGVSMCPSCELRINNRPHCKNCYEIDTRDQFIESIRRITPSKETIEKTLETLSFPFMNREIRRGISILIDSSIVLLLSLPFSIILRVLGSAYFSNSGFVGFFLCLYISIVMVSFLYFIILTTYDGQTIGKKKNNLKVVQKNGKKLNVFGAFWRWVGLCTSLIWLFIGIMVDWIILWVYDKVNLTLPSFVDIFLYLGIFIVTSIFASGILVIFVGRDRRGFHDVLANSVVIDLAKPFYKNV